VVRFKELGKISKGLINDKFQFQSGAIQSVRIPAIWFSIPCFNSKVVRFKAALRRSETTINASFNSKVVRFKDTTAEMAAGHYIVSIPKWCDSKKN